MEGRRLRRPNHAKILLPENVFALRANGRRGRRPSRYIVLFMTDIDVWKGRRLPHWQAKSDAAYFVTFRLYGSIPQSVVEQHRRELCSNLPVVKQQAELRRLAEQYLDQQHDALLKDAALATIVKDVLLLFDQSRYQIIAWTVMPNHVHVVFRLAPETGLDTTIQGWKSVSSHRINRLIKRKGKLWQPDYFDRIIRNERMLANVVQYVRDNPEKAGLRNWPFVG